MQLKALFRHPAGGEQSLEFEYVNWRRASDAVSEAYLSWIGASCDERWLAHAAYLAALDREERAASTYRRVVELAQAG